MNFNEAAVMLCDMNEKLLYNPSITELIKKRDAAIKKIQMPRPDPETGLVRCGCGGKATLHPTGMHNTDVMAECGACSMAVICKTKESAKTVWNKAMGYKDDEE